MKGEFSYGPGEFVWKESHAQTLDGFHRDFIEQERMRDEQTDREELTAEKINN